jgi:hypothetical protein
MMCRMSFCLPKCSACGRQRVMASWALGAPPMGAVKPRRPAWTCAKGDHLLQSVQEGVTAPRQKGTQPAAPPQAGTQHESE